MAGDAPTLVGRQPGRCRTGTRTPVRWHSVPAVKSLISILLLSASLATSAAPVFEDSMAQRMLACSACHGKEGRAGPDGYYPRIAGKPAGYLYNQLLNFRDGRRHYGLMARLLVPLSDAYLLEIAGYFAALDLPYPPPSPANLPAAMLQRGQALALHGDAAAQVPACASCHGPTGRGDGEAGRELSPPPGNLAWLSRMPSRFSSSVQPSATCTW